MTGIINQLEAALGETVQLLSSFSEKEANTIPFEGSWTAAQVAQHLFLSEDGLDKYFLTPTQAANRQPDARALEFKNIFLDFTTKMKSPNFILPEDKIYNTNELINLLSTAKSQILEAVKMSHLNEMAPLEEGHPLKESTKLEIAHFVTYHTMRHNHQIKNIASVLHVKV